jgi:hypothetical protein
MEAVDAEMWQDAEGQPEDSFSPFVADTELDDPAEEHQEKKEENPPGTPLQPEDVPSVESKATEREDDNKNKGTFQDTSALSDIDSHSSQYLFLTQKIQRRRMKIPCYLFQVSCAWNRLLFWTYVATVLTTPRRCLRLGYRHVKHVSIIHNKHSKLKS